MTESERLQELLRGYADAREAHTETLNIEKAAKKAHDESKATLKAYEQEILELMCNLDTDREQHQDLVFHCTRKEVNVINEEAALAVIKRKGLEDQFIKITQAGLKKHYIDGCVDVELHPALVVKVEE